MKKRGDENTTGVGLEPSVKDLKQISTPAEFLVVIETTAFCKHNYVEYHLNEYF